MKLAIMFLRGYLMAYFFVSFIFNSTKSLATKIENKNRKEKFVLFSVWSIPVSIFIYLSPWFAEILAM